MWFKVKEQTEDQKNAYALKQFAEVLLALGVRPEDMICLTVTADGVIEENDERING